MTTLAVYNTCQITRPGLSERDNRDAYVRFLVNLKRQLPNEPKSYPGNVICVSGCMMRPAVKEHLQKNCPWASFVWVDEVLPLNVTFNHAVQKMRQEFGPFTHYLYVDSGVDVGVAGGTIDRLASFAKGDVCCAAAMVDTDGGYEWLGVHAPPPYHALETWARNASEPIRLCPGRTVNLHCQVWTEEFYLEYGKLLPDIFASDCAEQVTPYLCSAMRRKFVMAPVLIHHEHMMDGASSGFQRGSGVGVVLWKSPKDIRQLISEGREVGWGFEQYLGVLHHKGELYDNDQYPLTGDLSRWLHGNMFLTQDRFDYCTIKHEFLP